MEGGRALVANGPLGLRCIWWLLRCSHLVVLLCIALCLVGAPLTTVCGVALFPVALLRAFLPTWCSFFLWWRTQRCWCALQGGAVCRSLPPVVAIGLSHCHLGGTKGTRQFCTCLQICRPTYHWCLLGLFCGECDALLLLRILGC